MAGIKLDKCPCCGIEIDPVKFQEARDHIYLDSNDIKPKFRWIQCSERLPDRFDTVLLAILSRNGYGEPAYYVTIGGLKHGNEFESYTGGITECETVTHWMPLPDPPKEVDENGRKKSERS